MPLPDLPQPVLVQECTFVQAVNWIAFDYFPLPEVQQRANGWHEGFLQVYDISDTEADYDFSDELENRRLIKLQDQAIAMVEIGLAEGKLIAVGDYGEASNTNKRQPFTDAEKLQYVDMHKVVPKEMFAADSEYKLYINNYRNYSGPVDDPYLILKSVKGEIGNWRFDGYKNIKIITESLLQYAPPSKREEVPPYQMPSKELNEKQAKAFFPIKEAIQLFASEEGALGKDRFKDVFNIIIRYLRSGYIKAKGIDALKRQEIEIPSEDWLHESFDLDQCSLMSNDKTISNIVMPQDEILKARKDYENQKKLPPLVIPDNTYTNPYLELMKQAISELKITESNQPKKEELKSWLLANYEGEIDLSGRVADTMATILRMPDRQKGRAYKE
jgi:hypothetical protein